MITQGELTSAKRSRNQRVNHSEPPKIITKSTKRRYAVNDKNTIRRRSNNITI